MIIGLFIITFAFIYLCTVLACISIFAVIEGIFSKNLIQVCMSVFFSLILIGILLILLDTISRQYLNMGV